MLLQTKAMDPFTLRHEKDCIKIQSMRFNVSLQHTPLMDRKLLKLALSAQWLLFDIVMPKIMSVIKILFKYRYFIVSSHGKAFLSSVQTISETSIE
jgi:hypothetical protein